MRGKGQRGVAKTSARCFRCWKNFGVQIVTVSLIVTILCHILLVHYSNSDDIMQAPLLPEDKKQTVLASRHSFENFNVPQYTMLLPRISSENDTVNNGRRNHTLKKEHYNLPQVARSKKSGSLEGSLFEDTVVYLSKYIKISYGSASYSELKLRDLESPTIRGEHGNKENTRTNVTGRSLLGLADAHEMKRVSNKQNRNKLTNVKRQWPHMTRAPPLRKNQTLKHIIARYQRTGKAPRANPLRDLKHLKNKRPDIIKIVITNIGSKPLSTLEWQIFYSQMAGVRDPVPAKYFTSQEEEVFQVTKVTENVLRLDPNPALGSFQPGQEFYIFYKAVVPAHRFDVFPNWYVTARNVRPRVIQSTAGESLSFVNIFSGPDAHRIVHPGGFRTAESDYNAMATEDLGKAPIPIIPTPMFISQYESSETVTIEDNWAIYYSNVLLEEEASYLSEKLELETVNEDPEGTKVIKLVLAPVSNPKANGNSSAYHVYKEDCYNLQVHPSTNIIHITSPSPSGVYYGIQSLLSLFVEESGGLRVPVIKITDCPRLEYRGLMLDVSRNFFKAQEIMKVIDVLARYKMNKLHLHLTDSQGWRIEIPGLPELTEFGARRGHDPTERQHLMSVFGSGPEPSGLGCGYYTVEDYKRILMHARKNHVEIIPEIDLPGHARAAIRAMLLRYKKYIKTDEVKATEYLLSKPKTGEKLGLRPTDNVVDIDRLSTYKFVEHVVSSIVDMHKDILPLKTIHLGADEVASLNLKNQIIFTKRFIDIAFRYNLSLHLWQDHSLPALTAVWPYTQKSEGLQQAPQNQRQYQQETYGQFNQPTYYRRQLKSINNMPMRKQGRNRASPSKVQVPPSALKTQRNLHLPQQKAISCPQFTGPVVALQHWRNENVMQTMALQDILGKCYKLIHSAANRLYLDQPQDTHPEARGNMWAAYKIDTRAVHSYTPDFPMDNISPGDSKGIWQRSSRDDCEIRRRRKSHCSEPLNNQNNNYGLEVALWTELVRTPEQMFEMLLPRLLAAAERAWHRADWEWTVGVEERKRKREEDWTNFVNTLGYRELPRLEQLGFDYFIPSPGARIKDGTLLLKTEIPGLPVEISTDEKLTWRKVDRYKVAGLRDHNVYIRCRSVDGRFSSRVVKVLQKPKR